ncbi:MAG TPA: rRNA adenine N-6-methyltransferase family protein [Caulobacteraceae bacterium]|nr:rRNA adenine N-6-methyltransferase family protein [Caulobacteraceae bacterium]
MSGRRSRTRARLAQNLFADERSAATLVRIARIAPGERVYDLGAGAGAVTAALLAAGARVVAVERDPNLARKLRARFAGRAEIVEGDLRTTPLAAPFKVVANAPFNATADLMRRLLEAAPTPASATLVLQREAARRYAGQGRPTAQALEAQPWFAFDVALPFTRHDFTPAPAVEVAVLKIAQKCVPDLCDDDRDAWRAFVRHGLARPQADARRALRGFVSNLQWRRLAADLGLPTDVLRAELAYEDWLSIFRFVSRHAPPRRLARIRSGRPL